MPTRYPQRIQYDKYSLNADKRQRLQKLKNKDAGFKNSRST